MHALTVAFLFLTGCAKTRYVWNTEEEYFQLPKWQEKVDSFKRMKHEPHTTTLFIGDSMTEGFDLQRILKQDNLVNMGIGGDFTSGVLKRLDLVNQLQPKKIFIMIGINDILKQVPQERIKSQYEQIILSLIKQCPQAQLYVQENLPTRGIGNTDAKNRQYIEQTKDLSQFLQNVCAEHAVTFIPLYTLFESPVDQLNPSLTYDGLHLNEAGYQVWARAILPFIEKK